MKCRKKMISSGGSRNFERGFVGTYTAHRRRRCAELRSGDQSAQSAENFFYVFRSGSALIASLRILDMFPDAKKID